MKKLVKRLQNWILKWAGTKWGALALFLCAFADASFFGLPTPMLFLALALLNISNAYKYAVTGILGTMTGAVAGYAIGHFAWLNSNGDYTGVAQFLFNHIPGFSIDVYDKIHALYTRYDFWVLFGAAALPLPFKIFSISSGVFEINLLIFCIATLISQGIKFFLLAFLTVKLGPEVKKIFNFNWKPIAILVTATIALTIVILKIF